MRSTRDPPTRKQSEELTDDDAPVQDDSYTQMEAPHLDGPINLFEDDRLWGILRVLRTQTEHKLLHREKNGLKDHYVIGRSKGCDVVVLDKRVSSHHCSVYCDYSQATLRVFVEDNSSNGTFINGSWTKLNKKLRTELKSGDEIYLINPDLPAPVPDEAGPFLFINMRDRFAMQKKILHVSEADKGREINAVGRHIEDEYIIGEQLGSGMCGQVHRCVHKSTKKQYAVKIINTRRFSLSPGLSTKELREEAEIMRNLDHPHIIRIQDAFELGHRLYIVMELVTGGDLFDKIIELGKYSENDARRVLIKVMDAVSYLHGMNIVHRDLKPENILLTESNDSTEVKITDFGLAKRTNQEGLKTFCGTPQYFAPEVLKRKSPTDSAGIISSYSHKADVWSIGVITYIMLSGSFPFDDEHLFDQIEHAQYSLGGAEWCSVSSLAKHFIRSLMNLDIEKRLDVHQAINHPWIEQYRLANPSLQKVVPGSMRSSSLSPQHSNAVTHLPLPVEPSVVHAQEFADSKKYGIFAPPGTITPDRSILDGSNNAARNALQEELLILTAESNDELTLHNGFPKPTIFWSSKAALVKLASTKKKVSIKKVLPTVSPAVSTVLQKTVEGAAAHSITPQYDFCPSILNKAMTLSMVRESVTGKAVIDFVEYPDTVLNAVGESLQTEKKKRKRKMASAQSDSKVLSDDDIDSFSDDSNTKIVLPNSAAVTIVRSASKATKRANTITKVVGENSKALKIKKSVPDKVGVSEAICVIENAPLKQLEFVASVPSKLLSRRSTTISSTRRIVAAAANSIQSSRKGIESYFFKKQRVLRSPVPSMSAAFVEHSRQEELPHDIVMN